MEFNSIKDFKSNFTKIYHSDVAPKLRVFDAERLSTRKKAITFSVISLLLGVFIFLFFNSTPNDIFLFVSGVFIFLGLFIYPLMQKGFEHKLKVLGKGNKERYTILPDITIKFLRLYCKEKKITRKNGYLFVGTSDHDVMNSKTIINYFTRIKNEYNLNKNLTFHCLRHSFATYYLLNGGNILTLKSMLGHKSLNSTTIYLHLSQNFNSLEGIKYV